MGARRTAWHYLFAIHLRRFADPRFEVRDEVPLSTEPPRMDYLLLRRTGDAAGAGTGTTLRGLWPRLSLATVMELKTIGRPYRPDDLDRLWSYLHLFRTDQDNRPPSRCDLRGALVVPLRTPSLLADVDEMGLRWEDLGGGYWQLHGGLFTLHVVELEVVCEQEDDDFLRGFTRRGQRTQEGIRFWAELVSSKELGMSLEAMEDYDEVLKKFLDEIPPEPILKTVSERKLISRMAPEERLAGLTPEERVADLTAEERLLAMPDSALRYLPDEYLATLSEPIREAIRRRTSR